MIPALAPGIQGLLAALVLAAAVCDIRYRRIPNWLTVTGLVLGIAMNAFLYAGAGLRISLLGFALGFGIYVVLFALRAMGAGDVKLMAAIGAVTGPANWLAIFVLTAILGGAAAIVLALARGRLRKTFWNVGYIVSEISRLRAPYLTREELDVKSAKALRLPHGAVIAAASLALVALQWMAQT